MSKLVTFLRYQTQTVFSGTLTDETVTVQLQAQGNALLCSSLMHGGTGQVTLNYYQQVSGVSSERTPLTSRVMVAPSNEAEQDILNSIHNKVFCEIVVTGSIDLEIIGKAIDQIVTSGSSGGNEVHQILEGELVQANDKGTLAAAVDSDGNAKFLRMEGDELKVSSDTSAKVEGRVSTVTVSAFTWTPIPASPLAGRRAINIQNPSGQNVYLNYSNTALVTESIKIASDGERSYDAKDSIVYYARLAADANPAAIDLIVEEIS